MLARRPLLSALTATLLVLPLAAAAAATPTGAPEPAERLSTEQLIERAVDRGEIDRDTGWIYLAYALSPQWERVPSQYIGNAPWDGTILLLRLQEALPSMKASTKSAVEGILGLDAGSSAAADEHPLVGTSRCLAFMEPALTMLTENFYIEYNPLLIGGGLTVQDYAKSLETSWVTEVDEFGWGAPPVLPSNPPPGNRYHVRIEPLGPLLYGFVTIEGSHAGLVDDNPNTPWPDPDAHASCMVHNSDYSAFPGSPQQAMDATSAHEFHHSVQYGFGAITGPNRPDDNFIEGSATWMEDEVFDGSNDNYNYLWPAFHDDMGQHEGSEYAYWITWRGLVERYGTTIPGGSEQVMQDFWEALAQSQTSAQLTLMDQTLQAYGTNLRDAYHAYAINVKFNNPCTGGYSYPYCFEEGPAYEAHPGNGEPAPHGTISSPSGSFSGQVPDNYALNWVALPTSGRYTLSLANTSTGGELRGTLACDTGKGFALTPLPSVATAGQTVSLGGTYDPTGCRKAVLVITNQAQTAPNPSTSANRSYTVTTAASNSFCYASGPSPATHFVGTSGHDIIDGTDGPDAMCGKAGHDVLRGHGGDDVLNGGVGQDTLRGGEGSDMLEARDGIGGNDGVDGGPGIDRCRYDPGDVVVHCP